MSSANGACGRQEVRLGSRPKSAAIYPSNNPAPRKEKPRWTGGAKVTTQLSVDGVMPSTAKLRNVANLRPMAKLSVQPGN